MRVLVTGGAGFIGSNLVELLCHQGIEVICLDNFFNGFDENLVGVSLDPNFTLIRGDILNAPLVEEAIQGCKAVVHLAALGSVPRSFQDPVTAHQVNTTGFLNLLWAARNHSVDMFIYASSSSVYGDNADLPKKEEKTGNTLSPYAITKRMNEEYARVLIPGSGMEGVGLRFFNVFGPKQRPEGPYAAAIPRFINASLQSEGINIYGDGEQSRDFTYVDNVTGLIASILTSPTQAGRHEVYNVGAGATTTVNDTARMVLEFTGMATDVNHVPQRKGDILHSHADISRAQAAYGYRPSFHIKEGIRETVAWMREYLSKESA